MQFKFKVDTTGARKALAALKEDLLKNPDGFAKDARLYLERELVPKVRARIVEAARPQSEKYLPPSQRPTGWDAMVMSKKTWGYWKATGVAPTPVRDRDELAMGEGQIGGFTPIIREDVELDEFSAEVIEQQAGMYYEGGDVEAEQRRKRGPGGKGEVDMDNAYFGFFFPYTGKPGIPPLPPGSALASAFKAEPASFTQRGFMIGVGNIIQMKEQTLYTSPTSATSLYSLIEYGARQHFIGPSAGKWLTMWDPDMWVYVWARGAFHPGREARHAILAGLGAMHEADMALMPGVLRDVTKYIKKHSFKGSK